MLVPDWNRSVVLDWETVRRRLVTESTGSRASRLVSHFKSTVFSQMMRIEVSSFRWATEIPCPNNGPVV